MLECEEDVLSVGIPSEEYCNLLDNLSDEELKIISENIFK